MEVKPLGLLHAVLKDHSNEHYTIERPSSYAQNIIFGTLYVEHVGTMTIRNWTTGHIFEIEFKKRGWSAKDHNLIQGKLMDSDKKVLLKIKGKWNEEIFAKGEPGSGLPEEEFNVFKPKQ
jgi:hypothetical protein